jgi:hypothetical protein
MEHASLFTSQEVHRRSIKKSLKQQPLLEAKSKRGPLATGVPLPFLLYQIKKLNARLNPTTMHRRKKNQRLERRNRE